MANEADHYIQVPAGVETNTLNHILSNKNQKKLIVYKTIGSHWLFHDRYPIEYSKFSPNFKSSSYSTPSVLDKEKLENDYANSILYSLDQQLYDFISVLKKEKGLVSLSFISDHGIASYDDGKSLYSGTIKASYNIAMLFWFNDKYSKIFADKINLLNNNKDAKFTSACFLDTQLDIGLITSNKKKGCNFYNKMTNTTPRLVRDFDGKVFDFDKDVKI
jgi:glucan phosphoethanolaminetransferase (alkaline phosphatase superfamily)